MNRGEIYTKIVLLLRQFYKHSTLAPSESKLFDEADDLTDEVINQYSGDYFKWLKDNNELCKSYDEIMNDEIVNDCPVRFVYADKLPKDVQIEFLERGLDIGRNVGRIITADKFPIFLKWLDGSGHDPSGMYLVYWK